MQPAEEIFVILSAWTTKVKYDDGLMLSSDRAKIILRSTLVPPLPLTERWLGCREKRNVSITVEFEA